MAINRQNINANAFCWTNAPSTPQETEVINDSTNLIGDS